MEAEAPACKVLVVDDDKGGREGFSRFLEHAGFEAEHCADPATALQMAGRTRYDGFVVDILMAGIPVGHRLISLLRADPRTAKSPILAMTGYTDDLLREALALGADAATHKADFKNEGIPLMKRLIMGARLEARGAARVLVVEDDDQVAELMEQALGAVPYATRSCGSLRAAAHQLRVWRPELVLLDLSLPDSEGLAFLPELGRLRSAGDLGIIVVSASVGEGLAPTCLHMGADDFIRKPFDVDDLAARAEAVLRRVRRSAPRLRKSWGDIAIDAERRMVCVMGRDVDLTKTEFDILERLLNADGRLVESATLLAEVLNIREAALFKAGRKTLLVHVSNLRSKLGDSGHLIANEPGVGYRLSPPPKD